MISELARAFLALLPEALKLNQTDNPRIILWIPAKAPEVGDLIVYDDRNELTIAVGRIDHCHFESYCETGTTQQQEQKAAERAARWVQDIIADRVRFRNEFKAGRLISGSSWHPSHQDGRQLLQSSDEVREYTWSGEKLHEYRTG